MTTLDGLLAAHAEGDADALAVLGDLLEDRGDPRAARVRAVLECRRRSAACEPAQDADIWGAARGLRRAAGLDGVRLFAVLSARRVLHLMRDSRSRHALAVVELAWCGLTSSDAIESAAIEARFAASQAWRAYAAADAADAAYAANAYAAYAANAAAAYAANAYAAYAYAANAADAADAADAAADVRDNTRLVTRRWAVAVADAIPGWLAELLA